ncbi:MAG: phosphoribosyltransferase [Aeromonas veronii]
MKYPIEIENKLSDIENVISSWPTKKSLEDVVTWMLQFDNEDFDLAFRIIKNLNVIGPDELNAALAISYSKLMRRARAKKINISLKNTIFAAIGGASKSGAMIAYNFRLINELASANFLDDESVKYIESGMIENLVLVDDIIATGEQSAKELKEIAEIMIPLGVKNIFVLTAVGMVNGIKKVQETQLAEVFSALEYDEKDTITSYDSNFYDGLSFQDRKNVYEKMSNYGGLGYGGIGALITFYYNTPNCTLQSIWGDRFGWIPLFNRVSGITGIDKHFTKLENAKPQGNPPPTTPSSLTIFVEGKTDELFFDLLAEKHDNFGFKNIDTISIGPMYSDKLLNSLNKLSENFVIALDKDDRRASRVESVRKIVGEERYIEIEDIINYADIDSIQSSEEFSTYLDREPYEFDESISNKHIEMKLIKKAPLSIKERNLDIIVRKYLNEEKVNALIEKIKSKAKTKI